MRTLKAAILYFLLVFGAGFLLGTIRVVWLVPQLGTRTAELLEMPIMLAVIILSARWVVRRFALPAAPALRFGVGLAALAFLLVAELAMVLWLQGLSIREYVAVRDPVSGTVYLLMLGVLAVMPVLVKRR
jgi:hypothetical protein